MARKVVEVPKQGRRVVKKSQKRRVIRPKIAYFYAHLPNLDSYTTTKIHAEISQIGIDIEYSVSPSGLFSYRIARSLVDYLDTDDDSGVLILPIYGKIDSIPVYDEDSFWYLHDSWSELKTHVIEGKKNDKANKTKKVRSSKSRRGS